MLRVEVDNYFESSKRYIGIWKIDVEQSSRHYKELSAMKKSKWHEFQEKGIVSHICFVLSTYIAFIKYCLQHKSRVEINPLLGPENHVIKPSKPHGNGATKSCFDLLPCFSPPILHQSIFSVLHVHRRIPSLYTWNDKEHHHDCM